MSVALKTMIYVFLCFIALDLALAGKYDIYREYYMVARKYEIYFECEQDISRVSATSECDVLFNTRNKFHIFRATM